MNTSKKIIVKVGTTTLTQGSKKLSHEYMLELTRQIAHMHEKGHQVILVTSGAVATGRDLLYNSSLQNTITVKQLLAAIGQPQLMAIWSQLFASFGILAGQLLLTKDDFSESRRHRNTMDTLDSFLEHRIIPVINENDAVSMQDNKIGDNDNLAAFVAKSIGADILILLTDQQGLFTADPREDPDAKLISEVSHISEQIFSFARGTSSMLGTGGMTTKLEAAQKATQSGTTTVIASAAHINVIVEICDGKRIGTTFLSQSAVEESSKAQELSEIGGYL